MSDLQAQFGEIDIYLFDQLLRGRLVPGTRILDVGCGSGRNLVYLLRAGYQVFGVDRTQGRFRLSSSSPQGSPQTSLRRISG